MDRTVASEAKYGRRPLAKQEEVVRLMAAHGGGRFEVEWDPAEKVTPMGSLVYFAQYLRSGGLFERLCRDTPLEYTSPNAPQVRDVMGTLVLAVLNGHTRYAHVNALREDPVGKEVFDLSKIVSEDSVRRALQRGRPEAWDTWLSQQERAVWETLLSEPYVLDIDNTVKPLYGHQEGAEVSYNPQKPGRPSHNYHTYFIGALRLILGVDVTSGKRHAGKHGMVGLWKLLDSLPRGCRPRLLRGDVSYGNEEIMQEAERRAQPYLFKLRQTTKVQTCLRTLEQPHAAWIAAGQGWQGTERSLRLMGWSQARRCIFLRRPAGPTPSSRRELAPASGEFAFVETLSTGPNYEYMALVTNTEESIVGVAQWYRDRADCENVFDETKNQWGWAGFVTHDLHRCRIMARLIALIYNWWTIFTRLAQPEQHLEAITSRPLLLHAVGRLVTTGRRQIIRLTSMHAQANQIRATLDRIARFLRDLARTAEQLSQEAVWAAILSAAFVKWLRGKVLRPLSEGNQFALSLST